MKLTALVLLLTITCVGFAKDPKPDRADKRYSEFQGDWVVASIQTQAEKAKKLPEIYVNVSGDRFTLSGLGVHKDLRQSMKLRIPKDKKENPYRQLQMRGAKNLDDIVDVGNQISVFWFVGIYKWKDQELHLALKYSGQGLEGQEFRDFRPPSSFEGEPADGEFRFVLKRKR